MKKLLLGILTFVALLLLITSMSRGIKIADFEILSISDISAKNDELDYLIERANALAQTTYPQKTDELKSEAKKLADDKDAYLNKANLSTDADIKLATQEEKYTIEYLWTRLGNYATTKGVNVKFEIEDVSNEYKNIRFTVTGDYIAIIDYISAIENDTELNFAPKGFKLENNQGGQVKGKLQATFTVESVPILIEKEDVNNTSNTTNKTNTTNNTSNTDKEGNTITNTISTPEQTVNELSSMENQ